MKLRNALQIAIVIAAAFLLCGVVLWLCGLPPFRSLWALIEGSVLGWRSVATTLMDATPLLLTGLAVALAFRCGAFNIGAEGQFLMGALASTVVLVSLQGTDPTWAYGQLLVLPLALAAGVLGGAAWGMVPGILRVRSNVPEVISTIMLNFVALYLLSWAVDAPLKESEGGLPQSAPFADEVSLLVLHSRTNFHVGIFLALVAAVIVYIFLERTTWGFRMKATGLNPTAALHAGMRPSRMFVLSMTLSGGLAGLAGVVQVAGSYGRLYDTIGSGYGYTAIAVALLARLHPLAVILSALFFGALAAGSGEMQLDVGVPKSTVELIQGLIVLFAVTGGVISLHFAGRRRRGPAPGEAA